MSVVELVPFVIARFGSVHYPFQRARLPSFHFLHDVNSDWQRGCG